MFLVSQIQVWLGVEHDWFSISPDGTYSIRQPNSLDCFLTFLLEISLVKCNYYILINYLPRFRIIKTVLILIKTNFLLLISINNVIKINLIKAANIKNNGHKSNLWSFLVINYVYLGCVVLWLAQKIHIYDDTSIRA